METQQNNYYKIKLASKTQASNVAELTRLIRRSDYQLRKIEETPTFKMFADLKKRFDESALNPNDGG